MCLVGVMRLAFQDGFYENFFHDSPHDDWVSKVNGELTLAKEQDEIKLEIAWISWRIATKCIGWSVLV